MIEKMRNIAPEDRARMKGAGQEVRDAILKKAGFTDAELRQISEMRKQRGGPNWIAMGLTPQHSRQFSAGHLPIGHCS